MNKLDLEETTRRFHNVYEQVAKEYGYKTREDTKELDFNSPNGMTMLKTVETITTPYLEEIEELKNQLQQKENIIKEVREWAKKCSCQFTNDDGELVVSEISFNIQARPCDLFKILDKEVN